MNRERDIVQPSSDPNIDFLILADRAEAVNGKLYVMGGAWETTFARNTDEPVAISFAVGLSVPWNATNHDYDIEIHIEDPEGQDVFHLSAHFNQGRPPSVRPGDPQRAILAAPALSVRFPRFGAYYAVARITGGQHEAVKVVAFRVEALQVLQHVS